MIIQTKKKKNVEITLWFLSTDLEKLKQNKMQM